MSDKNTNNPPTIVVMHGDQTGEELLVEALRVLDPAVIRLPLAFHDFDLSLETRRATQNQVVHQAARAALKTGLALKAATITPETSGDVGSPNAILREALDAKVILRTGRRIPNVRPIGGVHAPIAIVRMAVEDAYGAKEWRQEKRGRRSPTALPAFHGRPAGPWPNFRSSMPGERGPGSLAGPNTR